MCSSHFPRHPLAANLLLPEGAGPVPAIIVYHPYLKDGPIGRGDVYNWQVPLRPFAAMPA